jgi:ethanolamine utilization cobalamin adenosyltransferase
MSETCLRPGTDVPKTHPCIAFRGALDSFQADLLEAQILMADKSDEYLLNALAEVLAFVRSLMSAEVCETPVIMPKLFGFTLDELHEQIRNTQKYFGIDHLLPVFNMGETIIRLNSLRTKAREVELLTEKTFSAGSENTRDDICYALNRLSSAVYWLYCGKLAGEKMIKPTA